MEELKKKREDLEKKYSRMMEAHSKRAHITNEGAHLDSAKELRAVYEELYEVALELGDPVPKWF